MKLDLKKKELTTGKAHELNKWWDNFTNIK